MNKIVYIFGAGFSAPLGLPLMNNFISKSKAMYFNSNPSKNYDYFNDTFKMIESNSYVKNFVNSDLFNIEELLSILEMCASVSSRAEKRFSVKPLCASLIVSPTISMLNVFKALT